MLDIRSRLDQLKRPRLLVRAARHGVDDYRRTRHLAKVLGVEDVPGHGEALMHLFDIEAELNSDRIKRNGNYNAARHVDVLIALSGEAREFLTLNA